MSWPPWFKNRPLADGIKFSLNPDAPLTLINQDTLVQKNANLLAVGEPAVLEFKMKPEREGEFRLRVRVTNDGAPGERHNNSLKLIVKGGAGSAFEAAQSKRRRRCDLLTNPLTQ